MLKNKNGSFKHFDYSAVVVAQLAERLFLRPEVFGLNTVIGKFLESNYLYTVNCIENSIIKKKRPELA